MAGHGDAELHAAGFYAGVDAPQGLCRRLCFWAAPLGGWVSVGVVEARDRGKESGGDGKGTRDQEDKEKMTQNDMLLKLET